MQQKMSRCYYCGTELLWEDAKRSVSGKKIPFETDGRPHRCPFRPAHNMGNEEGDGTIPFTNMLERVAKNQDELKVSLLQLLEIVQTLQTKLEMMHGSQRYESIKVEEP
jgi:hypothetical protein